MNIKSLITKYNIANVIHILVYLINIVLVIILFAYLNKNVLKTINIEEDDLIIGINGSSKNIDMIKFNMIIEKINSKKNTKTPANIEKLF